MKIIVKIVSYFFLFLATFLPIMSSDPLCVSLGSMCTTALALRQLGLRSEAFPFDWIPTPFSALYEVIKNDFEHFLTNIQLTTNGMAVTDHYEFYFAHDFPVISTPNIDSLLIDVVEGNSTLAPGWENSIQFVKEKYKRRIERFLNLRYRKQKIFFIRWDGKCTVSPYEKEVFISQKEAILLRDLIEEKYPKINFTLIILSENKDFEKPWKLKKIKNFYLPQHADITTIKQTFMKFDKKLNKMLR